MVVKPTEDESSAQPVADEEVQAIAQRRSSTSPDGPGPVPSEVEGSIQRQRSTGGRPLSESVRADMEPHFGRDLSGVRVHDSSAAGSAAQNVGARAFTVGRDVFFAPGAYKPSTTEGRRLLAHELTHTIQQQGGAAAAQPSRLQRTGDAEANSTTGGAASGQQPTTTDADADALQDENATTFEHQGGGKIQVERTTFNKRGTMWLPSLAIPHLGGKPKGDSGNGDKAGAPAAGRRPITSGQPFEFLGKSVRSGTQRDKWRREARDTIASELVDKFPTEVENWQGAFGAQESGQPVYYLRRKEGNAPVAMIGTVEQLVQQDLAILPGWMPDGSMERFDVDHLHEIQLGGLDEWSNFWLLQSTANSSSGRIINNNFNDAINTLITQARSAGFWTPERAGREAPDASEARAHWRIMIESFTSTGVDGDISRAYTRTQISNGDHLAGLHALNEDEVKEFGLDPDHTPTHLSIFPSPSGGFPKRFPIDNNGDPIVRQRESFYQGFTLNEGGLTFRAPTPDDANGAELGRLSGEAFKKRTERNGVKGLFEPQPVDLPLRKQDVLGMNAYVDQAPLREMLRNLQFVPLSPVAVDDAGIDVSGGALFLNGRILATKALFPGLEIPFRIFGDEVAIDFPIPTESLDLGPLTISEATLSIGANAEGLFFEGGAAVAIEGLGSGHVQGRAGSEGPSISGDFTFDLGFLEGTTASIDYNFATDALRIELERAIGSDALPGIAGGNISIVISRPRQRWWGRGRGRSRRG